MRSFIPGILLLCLAIATNASIQLPQRQQQPQQQQPQQQSRRTEVAPVIEEEPHPYTISFFLFPHGAASKLLSGGGKQQKKNKIENHKKNKTSVHKANATKVDYKPWSQDDLEGNVNYQQGSIKHPKSEMYPSCHQCQTNSTYHECIQKKTLQTCNDGLSNICYTKSVKRNEIVHYEMGCASHNQCQLARAKPCKLKSKRCFTCCQWSGCNSQSHHHKNFPFAFGRDDTELSFVAGAATPSLPWVLLFTGLLVCFLY